MKRGERLRLTIERPAAGGRMIARHEGSIVFVSGAIPGEVVDAVIEKTQRGTVWASTIAIEQASPDRVPAADLGCGGSVFAHIAYDRQRRIKADIISDAFRRIGRMPLEHPVDVSPSAIDGYRMRGRLHLRHGELGFFHEGSHDLCSARATRQLRDDTCDVLERLRSAMAGHTLSAEVELSENIDASHRAIHFDVAFDGDVAKLAPVKELEGITGATCAVGGHAPTIELSGTPYAIDTIAGATLRRHARSFFQGNRFLTTALVEHVLTLMDEGPLLDLYAGVGLFSLAADAAGKGPVTAVEGDRFSAADLEHNSSGRHVAVKTTPVEEFLDRSKERFATIIVDPPRTGMSKEALAGVIKNAPSRIVYVSCDIATLARDARTLIDAGYQAGQMRAFDLFPNTAHVETVMAFSR